MIPNDQPERNTMIERMVQMCMDNSELLNQWECEFIESIHDTHYIRKRALSSRQCEILEKIYDKLI